MLIVFVHDDQKWWKNDRIIDRSLPKLIVNLSIDRESGEIYPTFPAFIRCLLASSFSFSARLVYARSEHGQRDISQWLTDSRRRDKLASKRAGDSFTDEPLVPAERGRSSSISFQG